MTPLDNINAHHLLKHIQEQLTELVGHNLNSKLTSEDLGMRLDKYLDEIKSSRGVYDHHTAQVASYTIHDIKNQCVVRLNDATGNRIFDKIISGRRKAHKIGRREIGVLYTELELYSMPARRIQFTVKLD
jgi:hypothetical protein